MSKINDWEFHHLYRREVDKGAVPPLECTCGVGLVLRTTQNAEPIYWCMACNWYVFVTEKLITEMETALEAKQD